MLQGWMVYFKNTLFFVHCAGLDWCGQSEDMIWRQYGKGWSYLSIISWTGDNGGFHSSRRLSYVWNNWRQGGSDFKSVRMQWWSTRLPLSSSTSLSPPEKKNCSSFVTKIISFKRNYISAASEYFATLKMTRQLPPPLGRPCRSNLFSCISCYHDGPALAFVVTLSTKMRSVLMFLAHAWQ